MCIPVTPLIDTLTRLSDSTINAIDNSRLILSKHTLFGPIYGRNSPTPPLRPREATYIMIICISDPDAKIKEIHGPKGDFELLLNLIGYLHDYDANSPNIILMHDFAFTYTDANGKQKTMPRTRSGREDIRSAVLKLMQDAGPRSTVFFYFGGHGELVQPQTPIPQVSPADDPISRQNIIAGDGERISGKELRSWFCSARHRSVAITAIFDSCHSGGLLGLPFTYDRVGDVIQLRRSSGPEAPLPMLQISACRADQNAFSIGPSSNGQLYGRLTSALVDYLQRENEDDSIEGLIECLYTINPTNGSNGRQMPQVCCSRRLTDRVILL